MTRTCLIVGCGDLGQRAAVTLLQQGFEVHGLRRSPPSDCPLGIQWHTGDVTQPESLQSLPTHIDHLMYVVTPASRTAKAYREVFVEGLQNVVAHLQGSLQRIVFASSSAVYGEHGDDWVDESTPVAPLADNGRILLEVERWLATLPITTVSLRLAGLYGSKHNSLLDKIQRGEALAPTAPRHWANRIHREDAGAALAHVMTLPSPAPAYVGCDDTPLPLDELYGTLASWLDAPPIQEGPSPGHIGSKRLSNARLKASGFRLTWPETLPGYRAILQA